MDDGLDEAANDCCASLETLAGGPEYVRAPRRCQGGGRAQIIVSPGSVVYRLLSVKLIKSTRLLRVSGHQV